MGNFKVGNKVEIINAQFTNFTVGDVGVIEKIDKSNCPYGVKRKTGLPYLQWFREDQIKLVEPKPSKKQRIETLEKEVSELKLIVHELRERKQQFGIRGVTIENAPSTDISVEDKQADVIEFEGQQYRKVEREAREGDVVIFRENDTDPKYSTTNTPYPVTYVSGDKSYFKSHYDGGMTFSIYAECHNRTPETVDVYEPIKQPVQRQTVPCSATRPLIEEVGQAFFEGASKVLNPKTANQLRAEVIEKAKGFVEELTKYISPDSPGWGYDSNHPKYGQINDEVKYYCVKSHFTTNTDKREVAVVLKTSTGIKSKGIAKCNPSDVFNEHIGKAIALGRALGLDVSEFEQAVQPTVAVGQIVTYKGGTVHQTITHKNPHFTDAWFKDNDAWNHGHELKIINDTNAIYETAVNK